MVAPPPPPPPPAPAEPMNIPFGRYSDPLPQPGVKKGLNPIVVTLLATLGLVAVLYGVYTLLGSKKTAISDAATGAPTTGGQAPAAAAPVTSTNSTHPLAKHFELAGLRINESGKSGMTLQFLVINHSAADLPELKMMIHVKTTEGKPLYDFPVNIPSIGPFESKDLSVPMKTTLRGYELPDWQFLRGSFEITTQP
jgi:hypothetical protein